MLRISTKSIYESGVTQMNSLQTALNRSQMQLSSNRKNLTPADDPVATARALEVTQAQSINTQFVTNRSNAKDLLSQETNALDSTNSLLTSITELVVHAGNGGLTDTDRASLATQLQGNISDMLAQANTADGAGGYLFSGFKSTTVPYTQTATGAAYQGDQGQRILQVASARSVPVSDSGSDVFDSNLTGNGTFATAAAPGNFARGGSGIVSAGSVANAALLTGHQYAITFTVAPGAGGATTYAVTDTTLGVPVPNPAVQVPYVSGQSISFDGQQLDIKGAPANGDQFTLQPSTKESVFTTLQNLLTVLRAPGSGAAGQAALTNGLNVAHNLIDTASTNVLTIQAAVGSRLKEIDTLDTAGDDINLQYATTLSGLQDLNTVAAISLFTQQQTTLQAAQKSFTQMSGLSLFNYITA
ncbi:MAG TPA: flagellar hook-associated protein 3 [Janthinobacterium sp.]|nr:flagellar hook-associated protein 3 [Janthinobacterium sp.]